MIEREKVMRGLTQCSREHRGLEDCAGCPYKLKPGHYAGLECWCRLCDDALFLLKEQEPRALTLEEIKSLPDETDVWLEEIECIVVAVTISKQGEKWGIVKESLTFFYGIEGNSYNDGGDYEDADYGKYWRCWTSRPTPEQMRDTKWEGETE